MCKSACASRSKKKIKFCMLLESKNIGLWQIMVLDKYLNSSQPCRTPVRFLSHISIGNTWHDQKRLSNPEKIETVDKVNLFWISKTLPGYFRCVTRTITKICCDQRSLDMAHVCSLLICVNTYGNVILVNTLLHRLNKPQKCESVVFNGFPVVAWIL